MVHTYIGKILPLHSIDTTAGWLCSIKSQGLSTALELEVQVRMCFPTPLSALVHCCSADLPNSSYVQPFPCQLELHIGTGAPDVP